MQRENILRKMRERKLIAIIRGIPPEQIEETVQALFEGGIELAEITYDHRDRESRMKTVRGLERLRKRFDGQMCLGAGTVLTEEDVRDAENAGAQFIISPNVNERVIRRTRERELVSMPGAFTPTEIVKAHEYGADVVKLFPASLLKTEYIKAVRGPLGFIPLSAVGGVTPQMIPELLDAGISCFGVGGNLVDLKCVTEHDFKTITKRAEEYVNAVPLV